MNKFEVKMERIGSLFYIKVYFWSLETMKYEYCWIAVDTGAAVTSISKKIIKALGYDIADAPLEKVMTASRFEYASKIVLEKIKFGDYELKSVEVHAHDFPENNFFSGVLGLDILTKFDIRFLFSEKILEFIPIDGEAVNLA